MSIQQEKLKKIADKIRQVKESQEPIIPDNFADEIENVYEKGKNDGIRLGEKQQYDEFWDNLQDYGNRTDYSYAFSGPNLNKEILKPKYDICPVNARYMFYFNNIEESEEQIDMNDLKINIDFSKCTNMYATFCGNIIRNLGIIDMSSATQTYMCFYEGYAGRRRERIQKIIVSENTPFYDVTFGYASELKEVIFEGEMGQGGLDLHWSPLLSKDSLTSIINVLSDNATGQKITLSIRAVQNAYGSDSEEWQSLIATKPNWTISLL